MTKEVSENKSLYSISKELESISWEIQAMEEEGKEVPAELIERLTEQLTAQGEKVDNCVKFILHCRGQADFLKNEKKVIDAKLKIMARMEDRLKDVAKYFMESEGTKSLEGMLGHKFSMRESEAIDVIDEQAIPTCYFKISHTLDKTSLKNDIKAGNTIPGAAIKKNKSVTVK